MTTVPTLINGRWTLNLPQHRAERPEWPWWEAQRLAAMHDVIQPGHLVVDVGAEEGDFPGLWASWGADVVLFEPNPLVWPNIRAVFTANDLPLPKAWFVGFASDLIDLAPKDIDTRDDPVQGWPMCAYDQLTGAHGFRHLAEDADRSPQVTLDHFCEERGLHPDVVTIDVEGSELRVLRGAADILDRDHPTVFVSIHTDEVWMDEKYDRVRASDVIEFMADHGYSGTYLGTDHEAHWMFR